LLDEVLAAPDAQWQATLEALCARFPEHADALRRRFACLHDHGVIPAPLRALPHGSVFGDYELGAILGHGAMGVVFDAVHRPTGEPVALKVLRPELLDETKAQQRFRHEAEVAARLDHPHLCRVRDAGSVEGTPFLAMQRIVGDTLADRILRARRHGKAAAPSVLGLVQLIEKIARGLGHLHAQGLVHRDVKPGNILVTAAGEPVLCDFGLAWSSAAASLTRTGTALGTPAYMAPEQIRGEAEVTARADVYALGATLYESLALRPPFESVQREDLYRRILGDDADDVRKWNPAVPRALAVVVGCCLEKDPRRRYADGDALAEDLERLRAGRPVAARTPGVLRRLARTMRRHPVAASLLLAAALALAG
jgi:serine/threonine-protein kinase